MFRAALAAIALLLPASGGSPATEGSREPTDAGSASNRATEAAEGPGPAQRRSIAYVIAVGIDDYPDFKLLYAASDARAFARRIASEACDSACRSDGHLPQPGDDEKRFSAPSLVRSRVDSVVSIVLLDRAATLQAIDDAFARVIRSATKDDVVIFFFAGGSTYHKTADGRRVSLCMPGNPCARTTADSLSSGDSSSPSGLSSSRLRLWLESVRADRQLVVIDACSHPDYASDFMSAVVTTDPTEAGLTSRQRVVVANLELGMEVPGYGGLLTHVVTSSPFALTAAPFSSDLAKRSRFAADLHARAEELERREVARIAIDVFFEREALKILARAYKGDTTAVMRGIGQPAAGPAPARSAGRHHALIIGTSVYDAAPRWRNLANPVLDAGAVARELAGTFGFDTTVLVNPTRREINAALRALQDREYGENDQVFIFVAGHGYYDERMDMGFLVARDARALGDDPDRETYISFAQVEGYVNKIPAKHIMVALDVCFGGAFSQSIGAGGSRGEDDEYGTATKDDIIARKMRFTSRLYIASGGKEYVPDGRPGRHSPFASRLLAALRDRGGRDGILTMSELLASLETIAPPAPAPRAGEFGDSEPGADFLFIAR